MPSHVRGDPRRALELLPREQRPDTAILTLQTGLGNEEQLAALFGAERVLGGVAFVCINRASPGTIHHIDHGAVRLGELARVPSPRAEASNDSTTRKAAMTARVQIWPD